ncbi:MAG: mercury(II) reductase [Bacteriovoracaceae bacterium]|nr:mercury(II) reductase [Bacteriovoracaceae bacterium]
MDCCNDKYDYDILIIGSGSASFAAAIKASELGKSVGMIEREQLGGTCVNFGCVPSKTLIRAAETKHRIETSHFGGIAPATALIDFHQLMEDKNSLVSHLRQAKYKSVLEKNKNITQVHGNATFVDSHTVNVDGKNISGAKILIATGSTAIIPEIPGLKEVNYLTSQTAFELEALPERLIVVGGGYIALEIAQMFQRLGSKVTVIQRSDILFHEDNEVSEWISKYLVEEGIEILNHSEISNVSRTENGIRVNIVRKGKLIERKSDQILIATGRKANTNGLNLSTVGVELNQNGTIKVNEFNQTSQDHIYAAGDVLDSMALVYVAAYEGNLAIENAISGNNRSVDYSVIPWVIFSDPQIAGVGLNETQAKAQGIEYDTSFLTMDNVPRAIAARDTRGFLKLLRKTGTDQLIGARIVAPEGSELLMELSLMIKYKIPISEIASSLHPYLTLGEAVKLAAQTFDKDVKSLSCCAS